MEGRQRKRVSENRKDGFYNKRRERRRKREKKETERDKKYIERRRKSESLLLEVPFSQYFSINLFFVQ